VQPAAEQVMMVVMVTVNGEVSMPVFCLWYLTILANFHYFAYGVWTFSRQESPTFTINTHGNGG